MGGKGESMTLVRRAVATAAVTAVAAAVGLLAPPPSRATTDPPPLGWLHVEHPADGTRPFIADEAGREVILRGTNTTGLYRNHDDEDRYPGTEPKPQDPAAYEGTCPANDGRWGDPPMCQVDAGSGPWTSAAADSLNDLSQMRAFGWNFLRLAITWEQVEPEPGRYDAEFVERVAQVVRWAEEQRIYVLVDFHQDNYGDIARPTARTDPGFPPLWTRPTGQADGPPRWAVMADGRPHVYPLGFSALSPAVSRAFTNFWNNAVPPVPQGDAPGPGLQDHYIGAVAAVVARLRDEPAVVGFEIMNEPQPGEFDFMSMARDRLYPFYARVIQAVTGVRDGKDTCAASSPTALDASCAYPDLGVRDTRHALFFEPNAFRNIIDVSIQPNRPFTTYPEIVYAPHVYTHVFTLDRVLFRIPPAAATWPPYSFALQTADAEARAMGAALVVTEFGGAEREYPAVTEHSVAEMDRYRAGAAQWAWKNNCGLEANCDDDEPGRWTVYATGGPGANPPQNGSVLPAHEATLARVYPRLTAGRLGTWTFDPDTGRFEMSASSTTRVDPGDRDHETLVVVPPHVAGGSVTVGGAAVLDDVVTNPDGSRWAWIAPTGTGTYSVSLA